MRYSQNAARSSTACPITNKQCDSASVRPWMTEMSSIIFRASDNLMIFLCLRLAVPCTVWSIKRSCWLHVKCPGWTSTYYSPRNLTASLTRDFSTPRHALQRWSPVCSHRLPLRGVCNSVYPRRDSISCNRSYYLFTAERRS